MPDSNSVDLPWIFSNGFFPTGPEIGPSPDVAALFDARWDFPRPRPEAPRRAFRFAVNEGLRPPLVRRSA